MTEEKRFELELKKFEFESRLKESELELKKKEMELKIQEQVGKKYSSPIFISVIAGILALFTGVITRFVENTNNMKLEDKKFQSGLLLKATEAKNYDEFSSMLVAFEDNGLLNLPPDKIRNFRKERFINDKVQELKAQNDGNTGEQDNQWVIVASSVDDGKKAGVDREKLNGLEFANANTWERDGNHKTILTGYTSINDMAGDLFEVNEKFGKSSTIMTKSTMDGWCPNPVWNPAKKVFECK
jgi:hypothetical protein